MSPLPVRRLRAVRPLAIALAAAGAMAALSPIGAPVLPVGASTAAHGTGSSAARNGLVRLSSSAPPRLPAGAVALHALAPNTVLHLDATLAYPGRAAMTRYLGLVNDPHSGEFHHYLTPEQVAARFGPSPAAISSVRRQLVADGLTVGALPVDHASLPFSASAAAVEAALKVRLESYRLPGGRIAFANEQAPLVATSLATGVTGFTGLDDVTLAASTDSVTTAETGHRTPSSIRAVSATTPCADASAIASGNGPYTPDQLAAAYGIDPLYADGDYGQGITIGIIEAEPYSASDVAAFESCMGITPPTLVNHAVDGFAASGPGSTAEAALDIEVAIAIAPEATFNIYGVPSASPAELEDADAAAVGSNDIISTSWGQCELDVSTSVLDLEATTFATAALDNEAVFAASGDTGAYDCASISPHASSVAVDDPADQQNVVAVGGTTLSGAGSTSQAEVAWNNTNGATGGGVATNPTLGVGLMPPYQRTALTAVDGPMTSCGGSTVCRDVPDVSAMADPGFVIDYCQSGDLSCPAAQRIGWQGVGGTSGAAPMWAAMAALVAASPYCSYDATTPADLLGSFPADLYGTLTSTSATGQSLYSSSFTDILTGTNGYYSAGPGYDLVSGLGSPVVAYANSPSPGLAASLCAESGSPPTPTISSINPSSGPDDQAVNVTLTGTNFLALPGAEQLKVGSVFATNVSCTSATSCTATIPELDAATGAITPVLTVAGLHQSASSPSYTSIPAAPVFSALANPSSLTYGSSSALSIAGLPSDASGTVTFTSGTTALCSYVLGAASSCATPSNLAAGTYPISATYSGDTNFLSSNASTSLTVTEATTSISATANPGTTGFGTSQLLSVQGLGPGATGTVTFSSGGSQLCSYAVDSATACSTPASLRAGSYSVTASYAGDANNSSASATTSFVVDQVSAGSVLIADALPSAVTTGSSVTLVLAGLAPAATGTVTFTSGTKLLCNYTLPAASSCRTAATLVAATYPVTAVYSGDANFTPTSTTTRFTVAAAKVTVKGKKCSEHREKVTLKRIVVKKGRLVTLKTTKMIEVKVCTRVK